MQCSTQCSTIHLRCSAMPYSCYAPTSSRCNRPSSLPPSLLLQQGGAIWQAHVAEILTHGAQAAHCLPPQGTMHPTTTPLAMLPQSTGTKLGLGKAGRMAEHQRYLLYTGLPPGIGGHSFAHSERWVACVFTNDPRVTACSRADYVRLALRNVRPGTL